VLGIRATWTIARLVAERPNDDRGVVLVTLQHAHASVHDGVEPQGVVGRHNSIVVQSRVKAVCLHVRLIHKVKPILIAELIPAWQEPSSPVAAVPDRNGC
jgi:hypothetical protein